MLTIAPKQAKRAQTFQADSEPVRPQPGPQETFLASSADIAVYGGAAGGGKALYNGSMIPTPTGWKTVKELRSGDLVFGMDGQPTKVLTVSDVMTAHVCWRLTFDDDSVVIADDEHWWLTFSASELSALSKRDPAYRAARRLKRSSRTGGKKSAKFTAGIVERNKNNPPECKPAPTGTLRTTREIAATLRARNGRANHAVPVCAPLNLPDATLPLDPYVLGLWLGDGTASGAGFTSDDREIIRAIRALGWPVVKGEGGPHAWIIGTTSRSMRTGGRGLGLCNDFSTTLRLLGVLNNKHVPITYLRASRSQRLALLQGLMDSDGTVAKDSGSAEFTSTNRQLAEAVVELACSLGHKANMREGVATLYGRVIGPKWTVKWTPSEIVFRLRRKAVLQKLGTRRTSRFRYIVKCERVKSVPVQCIKVAAADGMFLTGQTFIPTHNTFALLMEASRHIGVPNYAAVIFRRTYPEVTAPGGLWPESMRIYPLLRAHPNGSDLSWKFPAGSVVRFGHLQYETDVLKWLGAQIALIGFDQLETFHADQFWYMLSRNRSTCGIRPYIRATANPQPGWLADFLSWWIDPATGYPLQERSGVLRWFVRRNDDIIWGDSPGPLRDEYGTIPKSVTFIGAKLTDNKKLMDVDPGYLSNLQALPRIDRERLEKGNWGISNSENEWPAEFFDKILFDDWPADWQSYLRVMSLDPSKGKQDGSGDYSAWIMLAVEQETMMLWVDADMSNTRPVEPLASNKGMRSIVTDGIDLFKKFLPRAVLVEINGFQSLVADSLLRRSMQVGVPMPLYTVNNTDPKPQRIVAGIDAILAQRRIRVKNTPGGRMLLAQLRDFKRDQKPSSGVHDDGPDALAAGIEMANAVINGTNEDGTGIQVLRG